MENGFITTEEAAGLLGRSRRWVQDLILRGQLKAEKIANVYVVRRSDVNAYQHQSPGRPASAKSSRVRKATMRRGIKVASR